MEDRTDTARTHDDSDIIDAAEDAPSGVGRAGGNLQRDVGTRDDLGSVDDPEGGTRVTKEDDIAHAERKPVSGTPDAGGDRA